MAESIFIGMETQLSTSLWFVDASMESYPTAVSKGTGIFAIAHAGWKAFELSNRRIGGQGIHRHEKRTRHGVE